MHSRVQYIQHHHYRDVRCVNWGGLATFFSSHTGEENHSKEEAVIRTTAWASSRIRLVSMCLLIQNGTPSGVAAMMQKYVYPISNHVPKSKQAFYQKVNQKNADELLHFMNVEHVMEETLPKGAITKAIQLWITAKMIISASPITPPRSFDNSIIPTNIFMLTIYEPIWCGSHWTTTKQGGIMFYARTSTHVLHYTSTHLHTTSKKYSCRA